MEGNTPFRIGDYVSSGKKLGRGAFATVYLGQHKYTGELVAIKVVDLERLSTNNKKLKKHLESEIEIMNSLKHENIVQQHDVIVTSEYIYMILQYCEGGDFAAYLKEHKRLSESTAKHWLRQLASGLKFLHSKNIIHRDLKPQNLLLSSKDLKKAVLKIADFGFARFTKPHSVVETLCGSPLYMAPEILKQQKYNDKADLWSVGVILYEMLTGRPPFNVNTLVDLVSKLGEKVEIPSDLNLSSECTELVLSLLKSDSHQRISWDDFFNHPFFSTPLTSPLPSTSPQQIPTGTRRHTLHGGEILSPPMSLPIQSPAHSGSLPTPVPGTAPNSLPQHYARKEQSPSLPDSAWAPRKPKTYPFKESLEAVVPLQDQVVLNDSDSTDSFEMIDSASISTDSLNSQGIGEKQLIEEIDVQFKRATTIAELGDLKVGMQNPAEALALYAKSLHCLQHLLQHTKQIIQNRGLTNSPRLNLVVDTMCEQFSIYLRKAEYWKRNLRPTDNTTFCVEKMIYASALQMGKEAAVAEVLKNYSKGQVLYRKGMWLLQQLATEAHNTTDKEVLQNYVFSFGQRLQACTEATAT